MATRNPFVDFVAEQFEPLGEIVVKPLFGGHTVYCNGAPFALIAGGVVYLKADDLNRPAFEARGLEAFRPFEGLVVMQYYRIPPEIFEDQDALREWGGGAVAAGQRALLKKRTVRKRTAKKAQG